MQTAKEAFTYQFNSHSDSNKIIKETSA